MFGGEFGNLSPVIRYDIQGGLVVYNIFDGLVEIDFAKRTIVPMLALEWANPDPLTWRIKLREGVKWQKGFGEFTAEDVVYTLELPSRIEELPGRHGAVPRRHREGRRQVRRRGQDQAAVRRLSRRHHGLWRH